MSTVKMKGFIFTTALLIGMMGCEKFLPEEYDPDAIDTEMSTLDASACELVTRPLILHDTTFVDTGDPDSLVIDTITHDTLHVALKAVGNDYTAIFDAMILDTAQVRDVINYLQVTNIDSLVLDTMQVDYLIGSLLTTTLMWDLIDSLLTATFDDSVLDAFQTDELIDTLLTFIDMGNLIDSHFAATLGDSLLGIRQLDELIDALFTATYDSIATLADTLVADTSVALSHPNREAPTYIWYETGSGGNGELVIYTDEYVDVELVEFPVSVVQALAVDMDLAMISGCTYLKPNPQTKLEDPVPAIKSRHVFQTATESFLIRFTILSSGKIRVALLEP